MGAKAPCSCLMNIEAEQLRPNGNLLNRYRLTPSEKVVSPYWSHLTIFDNMHPLDLAWRKIHDLLRALLVLLDLAEDEYLSLTAG